MVPMRDDVRTRVIRAIGAEVYGDIGNSDLSLATRAADAVIRELGKTADEDVHQCRSCDQRNDTHRLGCPMHPDYSPDRTGEGCEESSLLAWGEEQLRLRESHTLARQALAHTQPPKTAH